MKVLFYLEPFLESYKPYIMPQWLDWYSKINDNLKAKFVEYDFRLVCFETIDYYDVRKFLGKEIRFSQSELRNNWKVVGNIRDKIERGNVNTSYIEKLLSEKLSGFLPDVIILLSESQWLRKLFPNALFINLELNWFFHSPYPNFWIVDTVGFGKGRVLAVNYDKIIESIPFGENEDIFIKEFIQRVRRRVLGSNLSANREIEDIVNSLRSSFSKVILLPLATRLHGDGETSIFYVLDYFFSEIAKPDEAYLLTMHPSEKSLTDKEVMFLTKKYPSVFVDNKVRGYSFTQHVIPYVDEVVSDFSSVSYQALFFGKKIISFQGYLPYHDDFSGLIAPLSLVFNDKSDAELRKVLYWLIIYYSIPEDYMFRGGWFSNFIRESIEFKDNGICWGKYRYPVTSIDFWLNGPWFNVGEHKRILKVVFDGQNKGELVNIEGWDEVSYLENNKDVKDAVNKGVFESGYAHYIAYGATEGRLGVKNECLNANYSESGGKNDVQITSNSVLYLDEGNQYCRSSKKIAVVLHLFYIDLWDEIKRYLENISEPFDLYVSVASLSDSDAISDQVLDFCNEAFVFVHPNRGRDIAPFIKLLSSGLLDKYDAVCKVHSKKSKHSQYGDLWRKECFDMLLGSSLSVTNYLDCIRSRKSGLIGPLGYLINTDKYEGSAEKVSSLLKSLEISDMPMRFFAGSMFWVRPSSLSRLVKLGLNVDDFEQEGGQLDGTLAHVLERVFAVSVMANGEGVSDTELPCDSITLDYKKPVSSVLKTIFNEQVEKLRRNNVKVIHDFSNINDPYKIWIGKHQNYSHVRHESLMDKLIHVIVFVGDNKMGLLADTLDSLANQSYNNWRLSVISYYCCPDELFDEIPNLSWHQMPIGIPWTELANKVVFNIESDWVFLAPVGITFGSIIFLDLYSYIDSYPTWKLIYADEDLIDAQGVRKLPNFKPDLNLDLLRSMHYLGDALFVEKSAFIAVGGLGEFSKAYAYDLSLKVIDHFGEKSIGHISSILFSMPFAYDFSINDNFNNVLSSHYKRNNISAIVSSGYGGNDFFTKFQWDESPLVSIVIPTKDRLDLLKPCIESVLNKTEYKNYELIVVDNQSCENETKEFLEEIQLLYKDKFKVLNFDKPYNYSAINNYAAEQANGEYLLLLNNDTVIVHENWLERMLNHGQREEVGVVGARLVFPNQTIQHAGVILGMGSFGVADHPHIGLSMTDPGYMNRAQVVQNFSAVTAACMLIRKSVYFEAGGLDEENFKVLFNDVDLCLKVRELGYKIVWTPYATVIHHGSSSIKADKNPDKAKRARQEADKMLEKWLPQLANDPAYNRNLSLKHRHFQIETETDVTWNVDFHDRPRVYAFPANESGIGEYRVRAPLRALTSAAMIESSLLPNHSATLIPDIVEIERVKPDTLLLQNGTADYLIHAWQQYRKFNNVFMIYSQDDLVHMLPGKHPLQSKWPKDVRKRLRQLMSHSDRLIVATEPLKEAYSKYISDIKLVPNYLENSRWMELKPAKQSRNGKKLRVGWAGGGQHHGDLEFIAPVIEATKDEVDWVFMGMCLDQIKPYLKEYHAGVAFDLYPQKLADLDLDLAIAPLEYNNFNMAKTNLRLLEYGILGWPVLCSDITPYRNAPVTLVGNNVNYWIKAIREKIHEPEALAQEGQVLRQWVVNNYLLEDHLDEWLAALRP